MRAFRRIDSYIQKTAWITSSDCNTQSFYFIGQHRSCDIHPVLNFGSGYINISANIKINIQCRTAVVSAVALDVVHPRNTVNLYFNGCGDSLFNSCCISPCKLARYLYYRRSNIGILANGKIKYCQSSDYDKDHRNYYRCDWTFYEGIRYHEISFSLKIFMS